MVAKPSPLATGYSCQSGRNEWEESIITAYLLCMAASFPGGWQRLLTEEDLLLASKEGGSGVSGADRGPNAAPETTM